MSEGLEIESVLFGLYAFVLAMFVGFEVITKVPPTLHTPLMSGANAISGITILGALASLIGSQVTGSNVLCVRRAGVGDGECGGRLPRHRSHARDVRSERNANDPSRNELFFIFRICWQRPCSILGLRRLRTSTHRT